MYRGTKMEARRNIRRSGLDNVPQRLKPRVINGALNAGLKGLLHPKAKGPRQGPKPHNTKALILGKERNGAPGEVATS